MRRDFGAELLANILTIVRWPKSSGNDPRSATGRGRPRSTATPAPRPEGSSPAQAPPRRPASVGPTSARSGAGGGRPPHRLDIDRLLEDFTGGAASTRSKPAGGPKRQGRAMPADQEERIPPRDPEHQRAYARVAVHDPELAGL